MTPCGRFRNIANFFLYNIMNTKYIFVTGGVASSLGKGIMAALVEIIEIPSHPFFIGTPEHPQPIIIPSIPAS